jgi:hypothetical protein
MMQMIGDVKFEYRSGILAGKVWTNNCYFDVYRKIIDINSEKEFKNLCKEAYKCIPDHWRNLVN